MRWWKAVGLAGAAGVVATGVVIVRAERRRRAYTPDQVREQLHIRYVQATAAQQPPTASAPETPVGLRARIRQRLRRRKPQNPSV
ncbi:hypothetical protein FOH10_01400 [Nocardia otitidiscaviarum]|uniref:Uncharacterized protein n=1 Tax=Nocardia otitidiscaviarum TaxID=1823 RepID=A0A516NFB0_9NOCA|nr:hypothetical protein [Nocardia otitidiscaviarum]MCP9622916.1 hypothetical protein [Nocardia otitidiscaviarum]QDP77600.1 hypothetical protein FOH10_01400 [Nocardia otitidiscaviarum]